MEERQVGNIQEHPYFEMAKRFGDNLTYGQIIRELEKFRKEALKEQSKEIFEILDNEGKIHIDFHSEIEKDGLLLTKEEYKQIRRSYLEEQEQGG